MERVIFADGWAEKFAGFGLSSFDDFFNYSDGRRINKNKRRDVRMFTLGAEPDSKVFFLKRFHNPYFKDMVFAWRNLGRICSQAAYEWENTNLLFAKGIETYRPACFGETITFGIESRSFLVTEQVRAEELKDFIVQKWLDLSEEDKKGIISQLGSFIRKIHNANISLPDLYIWHLFIKQQAPGQWKFTVIDLHRMVRNTAGKNEQIRNLARLDHSMVDKYFDQANRKLLIESYASEHQQGSVRKLADKVKRLSASISARRKPRPF